MPNDRTTIDASAFLRDQGITFQDMGDDGVPIVQFPDKTTGPLRLDQVQKDLGIDDPAKFSLEWNSPDSPVTRSPVEIMDRLKMTTSNDARSLLFLKKKFEDAIAHPDNGVLVKKNGAWHQVDPSFFGSGSFTDKAKEFAKDVVDVSDDIAGALAETGGAVLGAAPGTIATLAGVLSVNPLLAGVGVATSYAGSIAGAAAGSKALNKARFRLGRVLGTYSATEEEQDQDEALEMLYAAGGQAAAPFVGAAFSGIAKGVKAMPKGLLNLQAKLLGTEVDNLYRVADRPKQVENAVKTAWSMAKAAKGGRATSEAAQAAAMTVQKNTVGTIMDEASAELPKRYTKILAETAAEAGDDFTADVGSAARNILDSLASGDTPFLKKVVKQPATTSDAFQQIVNGTPDVSFRPFKDEEVLEAGGKTFFDRKSFQRFVNQVQGLTGKGKLQGEEAVQAIAKIKAGINETLRYSAQNAPEAELSKIAKVGAAVDEQLDNLFGAKEDPLRKLWESKAAPYRQYANSVNWGRRVMRDETGRGLETFTKQVASNKAGKGMAAKSALGNSVEALTPDSDAAGSLVELLGDRGIELMDRIADYESARAMSPLAPRLGMVQIMGGTMAATGPLGLSAKVATVGAGMLQSTPAVVRKEIQGAAWARSATAKAVAPFTDLMKGISKARGAEGIAAAMADKKFVEQLTTAMGKSLTMEHNREAFAKQILEYKMKNAGVEPNEEGK